MRMIDEQRGIQKRIDDIAKAMDAEKASLETMKGSGEKAVKKRAYYEGEQIAAHKRYRDAIDAIHKQYDVHEVVLESKEETVSSKKSIDGTKLDTEIETVEKKYENQLDKLEKEFNDAVEALRAKYQTRRNTLEDKCKNELNTLHARKDEKMDRIALKAKDLETIRKVKEAKRDAALKKEKEKFDAYMEYIKGQMEDTGLEPMSKRLATLKEQHRIALDDMEKSNRQYTTTLNEMLAEKERKRLAAVEKQRAEQRHAEWLELQRRQIEHEERMASHREWLAQKEAEKRAEAERTARWEAMTPEQRKEVERLADETAKREREESIKRAKERSRRINAELEAKYEKEYGSNEIVESDA